MYLSYLFLMYFPRLVNRCQVLVTVLHVVVSVVDSVEVANAEILHTLRCTVAFFPVDRSPSSSLDTNPAPNPIHPVRSNNL